MIDDLVTRGVSEPYRMFTSRAEYPPDAARRQCRPAADPAGVAVGCVGDVRQAKFEAKAKALGDGLDLLNQLSLTPTEAARHGLTVNRDGRRRTAFDLLALPDVSLERLKAIWPEIGHLRAANRGPARSRRPLCRFCPA